MPVELSDLLGNERWVEVELFEHVFKVAYRPSATSMRRQAELQRLSRTLQNNPDADELEQAEQVASVFCEMVTGWDLTKNGSLIPINTNIVQDLPSAVFNAIMEAIGNDAQSQRDEKKLSNVTSAAGLPREVKPAIAQNGIPQSEPRGTWA